MTKIALSILALAALSTASFADRSRTDFGSMNGGVTIETAALAVYGDSNSASNGYDVKEGGR